MMDPFRKASGLKPLNCAFSGSKRANLARGTLFLHCFIKISLASCASFSLYRLSRLSPMNSQRSTAQSCHRWGVVSSTWITAEMIFSSPYISFSSSSALSTPRFVSSLSVGDIAKLYRCYHLDCVFPNRFSSLSSLSNGHPPARHTFHGHLSVSERY